MAGSRNNIINIPTQFMANGRPEVVRPEEDLATDTTTQHPVLDSPGNTVAATVPSLTTSATTSTTSTTTASSTTTTTSSRISLTASTTEKGSGISTESPAQLTTSISSSTRTPATKHHSSLSPSPSLVPQLQVPKPMTNVVPYPTFGTLPLLHYTRYSHPSLYAQKMAYNNLVVPASTSLLKYPRQPAFWAAKYNYYPMYSPYKHYYRHVNNYFYG